MQVQLLSRSLAVDVHVLLAKSLPAVEIDVQTVCRQRSIKTELALVFINAIVVCWNSHSRHLFAYRAQKFLRHHDGVLQARGNEKFETQNLREVAGAAAFSDQRVTHNKIGSRFIAKGPSAITMHCSMLTTQIADFDRELLRTLLLTCVCPPVDPRKKQKNKSLVLQNL